MAKIKLKATGTIKNNFRIEVKDVKTGKIKQVAYAYNLVTNSGIQRFGEFKSSFDTCWAIAYGSGTGELDINRTSLFTHVGKKTIANRTYEENISERWTVLKGNIVLAPAEHVGATFTEIGVAPNGAGLTTHAFIEDSEGNPISIGPKTDTEQITFYCELYNVLAFDESGKGVESHWVPGTGNVATRNYSLANTGTTASSCRLGVSNQCLKRDYPNNVGSLGYHVGTKQMYATKSSNRTYNASTKVTTMSTVRFETGEANGPIYSILGAFPSAYGHYHFRLLLDDSDEFWSGMFIEQDVGTGDGSQTGFDLSFNEYDIEKAGNFIKVDGVEKTKGIDYTMRHYKRGTWLASAGKVKEVQAINENRGAYASIHGNPAYNPLDPYIGTSGDNMRWAAMHFQRESEYNNSTSHIVKLKYKTSIDGYSFRYYFGHSGLEHEISGSNDGVSWTEIHTHSAGAGSSTQTVSFTASDEFQYFRLRVRSLSGTGDVWLSLLDYRVSDLPQIEFSVAPGVSEPITSKLWADYIPKDSDHVLDISLAIEWKDANASA